MTCEWTFLAGGTCGDPAIVRTAGGLHLCADHLTDWARGVYRPSWVVLETGEIVGGITHGQKVLWGFRHGYSAPQKSENT
ncbi:MAG TPA: hypothetical protein VF910_01115 [Candidatus Bathyarchaeia archaeon]